MSNGHLNVYSSSGQVDITSGCPSDIWICPLVQWTNGHIQMFIGRTDMSIGHLYVHSTIGRTEMSIRHSNVHSSIGQTEMSSGHSSVHSSNGRTEMSSGHLAEVLDMYVCPVIDHGSRPMKS